MKWFRAFACGVTAMYVTTLSLCLVLASDCPLGCQLTDKKLTQVSPDGYGKYYTENFTATRGHCTDVLAMTRTRIEPPIMIPYVSCYMSAVCTGTPFVGDCGSGTGYCEEEESEEADYYCNLVL